METLILVFELVGTVAFAISGAILGLRKKLDLFGVLALGVVTATGGGVIRDLLLGLTPPSAFVDPVYISLAAVTAAVVFLTAWRQMHRGQDVRFAYKRLLFCMDSIGLGIFTVVGCDTAFRQGGSTNAFLCVFCGMMTGVGGGLLRDVMVDQLPDIFRKHIYAVASLAGGMVCTWLLFQGQYHLAIYGSAALVVIIRYLAAHFQWSLPRLDTYEERGEQK
jgi:uncharacterized membrane protein YeiH